MTPKTYISFQPEFDFKYNISYINIQQKQFYGKSNGLLREILQSLTVNYAKFDLKNSCMNDKRSRITTNMILPNDYFPKSDVYKIIGLIFKEIKQNYKINPNIPDLSQPTTLFNIAQNIAKQISK